jgi:hypothetical protein
MFKKENFENQIAKDMLSELNDNSNKFVNISDLLKDLKVAVSSLHKTASKQKKDKHSNISIGKMLKNYETTGTAFDYDADDNNDNIDSDIDEDFEDEP